MTYRNIDDDLLLLDLEYCLQIHDKYYDYSDDHIVYLNGKMEWEKIERISKELKLKGYTAEVHEAFEKFYSRG